MSAVEETMGPRVVAIGMDAADPALIESWMVAGHLPNLRRLRSQGAYAQLANFPIYKTETPWTTFLTGCSPTQTGFWTPIKYDPDTYRVAEQAQAADFTAGTPFYALGEAYRVAVFDVPQSRLARHVNGWQIFAWGAHGPFSSSYSSPPHLLQELIERHGANPLLRNDYVYHLDRPGLSKLHQALHTCIQRRAAICQDLLQREAWDLFLTVFGETHSAGHAFWHLSQANHPLYQKIAIPAGDALLDTYSSVDQAIGQIVQTVPDDAYIVIFSVHGMTTSVLDLPSNVFLPELLYRFSFPGQTGVQFVETDGTWEVHFGRRLDCIHPSLLQKMQKSLYYLPARWYTPSWPRMQAFALPSYADGCIRINLQGREAHGIVPPSAYHTVCDELVELVSGLQDARTGQAMVTDVIRTRRTPADTDPTLPAADLIILWQDQDVTDTVDSPRCGRIGPAPQWRAGNHRPRGFFLARGPHIAAHSALPTGHVLDLAPTLQTLMGAPLADSFVGQPLVRLPQTAAP
jgi:predicted AlkP superfamily phosphohydrolase/phosphomutase